MHLHNLETHLPLTVMCPWLTICRAADIVGAMPSLNTTLSRRISKSCKMFSPVEPCIFLQNTAQASQRCKRQHIRLMRVRLHKDTSLVCSYDGLMQRHDQRTAVHLHSCKAIHASNMAGQYIPGFLHIVDELVLCDAIVESELLLFHESHAVLARLLSCCTVLTRRCLA